MEKKEQAKKSMQTLDCFFFLIGVFALRSSCWSCCFPFLFVAVISVFFDIIRYIYNLSTYIWHLISYVCCSLVIHLGVRTGDRSTHSPPSLSASCHQSSLSSSWPRSSLVIANNTTLVFLILFLFCLLFINFIFLLHYIFKTCIYIWECVGVGVAVVVACWLCLFCSLYWNNYDYTLYIY